jgi:hypothetical protein
MTGADYAYWSSLALLPTKKLCWPSNGTPYVLGCGTGSNFAQSTSPAYSSFRRTSPSTHRRLPCQIANLRRWNSGYLQVYQWTDAGRQAWRVFQRWKINCGPRNVMTRSTTSGTSYASRRAWLSSRTSMSEGSGMEPAPGQSLTASRLVATTFIK